MVPTLTEVTPAPISTTTPAPSWPRTEGTGPRSPGRPGCRRRCGRWPVALNLHQHFARLGPFQVQLDIVKRFFASKATGGAVFSGNQSLSEAGAQIFSAERPPLRICPERARAGPCY